MYIFADLCLALFGFKYGRRFFVVYPATFSGKDLTVLLQNTSFIGPRFKRRSPAPYLLALLLLAQASFSVYLSSQPDKSEIFPLWGQLVLLAVTAVVTFVRIRPIEWIMEHVPGLLLIGFSIASALQMDLSIKNDLQTMAPIGYIWGALIALSIYLILYACIGRAWIAGIAGSTLFTLWAIASYYTLVFHGLPLSPSDLFSAGTALDVMGTYDFSPTPYIGQILCLYVCCLALAIALHYPRNRRSWKVALPLRAGLLVVSIVWIVWGCMGSLAKLAGFRLSEWNWKENYYQFGYLQVTCMKLAQLRFDPPYGYSDQAVADLAEEVENASTTDSTLPNLILIVNESWFDWRQVTEFTTDQPVTPYLDSLIESDSVVHGFTVGPLYASGTSTTEYELLTSNSTSMFPSVTPFTQQNLTSVNSLPRYLSALGYANASFHPASPQNYNRSTAYPALGFENSYWWNWEDYNSLNDAGLLSNDPYAFHGGLSDLSCFEVMEHLFEQRDSSQPLFLYNLTYQNHGGYLQFDFNGGDFALDDADHVRLLDGFDGLEPQAEEYLSSIRYTDIAFQQLTEYFSEVDEPVMICMVGDHAPPLGEVQSSYTDFEYELRSRGTPFVIWANYPIEGQDVGYISMISLTPLFLQTAGIELSDYYQSIVDMSEEVPLLSRDFYLLAGEIEPRIGDYSSAEISPLSLRRCLYFEYNNVARSAKRLDSLFLPHSLAG